MGKISSSQNSPVSLTQPEPSKKSPTPSSQTIHCCPYKGCGSHYHRPYRLQAHINSQHEGFRQFVCPHPACDKAFFRQEHLKRHLTKGAHPNKHADDLCDPRILGPTTNERSNDRNFESAKPSNAQHILDNANPFVCVHCSKSFSYRQNLKRHVIEIHSTHNIILSTDHIDEDTPNVPPTAGEVITAPKLRSGPRYSCLDCNHIVDPTTAIAFRKKDALKKHQWLCHGGTKPFPCDRPLCPYAHGGDKALLTASRLERHILSEHDDSASRPDTGPSPFKCSVVGCENESASTIGFKSRRLLTQHVKLVHGSLLRCSECDKTFLTNRGLKRHLRRTNLDQSSREAHQLAAARSKRVHTFPCKNIGCGKYYLHQRNLTQHLKRCDKDAQ